MAIKLKKSWLKMESEHTKSKVGQARIVRQHIKKYGPKYYPSLKKMENKLLRKRK